MIEVRLKHRLYGGATEFMLDVDFSCPGQKFLSVTGASGAGKTTILRMIAGLMIPDEGRIVVDGETWLDTQQDVCLSPQNRNVGLVFQETSLFPNMTVKQNLIYALDSKSSKSTVDELLQAAGISQFQDRKPISLSGGQKQHVALARALVQRPKLLLLDEPLSALDSNTKSRLQDLILGMHKELGTTTIMVSHNAEDIRKMTDELLVLENGLVQSHQKEENLPRAGSGSIRFEGEITTIEKTENGYSVSIRLGDQQIQLKITEKDLGDLQPGDRIAFSSHAANAAIEKTSSS